MLSHHPMFFCLLLTIVSLFSVNVRANPVTAASALELTKRYECDEYLPGGVNQQPGPYVVGCYQYPIGVTLVFQNDGNLVLYNNSNSYPFWNSGTYGRTCQGNNCTLAFQKDGNFVIYYNRQPIWYTSTGANIGKSLWVQTVVPYMYILNAAGQMAWHT